MTATLIMHIGTEEICRLSNITTETIIEIVEHGIIQPQDGDSLGHQPEAWRFDPQVITTAQKAARLHDDLEIGWAGIALAIELLSDLEKLRVENELLKQRIERFINC